MVLSEIGVSYWPELVILPIRRQEDLGPVDPAVKVGRAHEIVLNPSSFASPRYRDHESDHEFSWPFVAQVQWPQGAFPFGRTAWARRANEEAEAEATTSSLLEG